MTAVSWPRITVVATDETTGDVTAAQAKASGPEGHYTATLTFPHEGSWTLVFVSPELQMDGTATLSVGPAIAPPAATPTAAAPALELMPWALLLVVGALAVAFLAAFLRARESLGSGRVPVRN